MNYGVKKGDDNVKLVTKYMEWGSPMNQVFLIDALCKHADNIIENEDDVRESMKGHMISPDAWIQCAKDWKRCISDRDGNEYKTTKSGE